ncbi:unnamed protein product [Scytosiphon promiscuus]
MGRHANQILAVALATGLQLAASYDAIAGYTPVSDVESHSLLDLDMQAIDDGVSLLTDAGFVSAYSAYANGGNSVKSDDSIRTIRGFSLTAEEKLSGEYWFGVYEDYWGVGPDYADQFTAAACNGTGNFAEASFETRAEACIKGAQYQNVWMYVIHELEDAIGDCDIDDLSANDGGPHAWDEGWAFYAGSLEGTDGSGDGYMLHALAEKRCANFGTCTGDVDGSPITGSAQVNADLLELFAEGSTELINGNCDTVREIKDKIVNLITVPLVQGVLRYFYLADPQGGAVDDDEEAEKDEAELWAFAAAVLPRISDCDTDLAITIRANTELGSPSAPMAEGYVELKQRLESAYSCMGISCSQVGGLLIDGGADTYYEGFEPCKDSDDGGIGGTAIAFIVVAAAVAVLAVIGCVVYRRRNKKSREAMESDLGGFGANKPTSTL